MEPVKAEEEQTSVETPVEAVAPAPAPAADGERKAEREARMRERRRQRLAQHAGAREELITGVRREAPPAAAGSAGADATGAAPRGAADLEQLLRGLRGAAGGRAGAPVALPPRARAWARWGVLALVLALAGVLAHTLAGVPAARLRVALTTDSGSAWRTRRVALVDTLARPAPLAAGDVVAAHTTAQHARLVRAVVLDGVPVEAHERVDDDEGGDGDDEEGEARTVREWRVVPHVARRCADGAWLREDAVAGRVLLSLPPLVLFGVVSLTLRLAAWALRS